MTKKAVSPVIATILLILIAIAAGTVIYVYTCGFRGSGACWGLGAPNGGSLEATAIIDIVVATRDRGHYTVVYFANQDPYEVNGTWDLLEGHCYYIALTKDVLRLRWEVTDITLCEEPLDS